MRIIWSPLAISRVLEAAEYIAWDKPGAAAAWAVDVFDAVQRLAEFPRSGRIVQELGRPDVRELWHGNYRVIYRIENERILILTARHGQQLLDLNELEQESAP